jgi:hypothetical protein
MKKVNILGLVLLMVVILLTALVTPASVSDECPAAPAVAGFLLEEAGIDNRWGTGRDGGNYIKSVANHMDPETADFDGVEKCELFKYELAIAYFLNSLGAAVAYPGNVVESVTFIDVDESGEFGTAVGDEVIITFKGNIIKVANITADFNVNYPIISHGALTDWDITGNVLTFTVNGIFSGPRPISGESLMSIDGLEDFAGNPVVVPYGGVAVQ